MQRCARCRSRASTLGAAARRSRSLRILIVDDAAVECATLERILTDLGHEVVAQAALPADAVELATRCCPDLAIVDGRLPPSGGLAVLAALQKTAPGVRIAMVASLDEVELVRTAVGAGASGALRRPLLRSQVAAALAELAGRDPRSERASG